MEDGNSYPAQQQNYLSLVALYYKAKIVLVLGK